MNDPASIAPAAKAETRLTLKEVVKLKLNDMRSEHLFAFPGMTGWFGPNLLSKLLLKVIVSDVFGQYADRRLVHASLDRQTPEQSREQTNFSAELKNSDGAVWVDYVADLGDGFDATYAIAYLMAQAELEVGGTRLPRAGALVMGGDQIYPTADREAYAAQTRKPYQMAWPDKREATSPPLLAIPGNHDWYDGLVVFLAMFSRKKSTKFGNWSTRQRRSYFSAQLTDTWWIWGIDIALVRDMDQPQADYFVDAASAMPKCANIVLCSAEPGWYEAEKEGPSFRTLDYAVWIAANANKDLRIPLVLSGDSHHYAHYSGAGSEFITSGGGGAFLHGTIELEDPIKANWFKEEHADLTLKTAYPTPEDSKKLLDDNMAFFSLNKSFSFTLGAVYWLAAFVFTQIFRVDVGVIIFLLLWGVFYGYSAYQDKGVSRLTTATTLAHATAHFAAIFGFTYGARFVSERLLPGDLHWSLWALALAVVIVPVGGAIAGTIFGTYLRLTCKYLKLNTNDAFSSMKLDSHRHFLRMCIKGGDITVYPVGLDSVPKRDGWRLNATRSPDRPSIFEPVEPMMPKLIERPIQIRSAGAIAASDVKQN